MTNWFVFSVGVLQLIGGVAYIKDGLTKFGILYILYALTNFVIWWCKGE